MNILITNIWLVNQGGTEVYVRDLAIELHRRGHTVEVYSPKLGPLAEEIEGAGIHVCSTPSELKQKPQIIHAHQFIPCMEIVNRFDDVPIIYFVHDYSFAGDSPPKLDQIKKYVAVDVLCLRKLVQDFHIDESRTTVIHNWVDVNRFRLRTQFSATARKALVFSNYANDGNYFKIIKESCIANGLELDGLGLGFKNSIPDPENILSNYDIVFAKGKAAMEAMSSGAAVVVCDFRGLGAMVNADNFDFFRSYNFGMYTLDREITAEFISKEILKYDLVVAKEMAEKIRAVADFQKTIDQLVRCYQQVLDSSDVDEKSSINDLNVTSTYRQTRGAVLPEITSLKNQLQHTRLHEEQLMALVRKLQDKNSELKALTAKHRQSSSYSPPPGSSHIALSDQDLYTFIKSHLPVQTIGEQMTREFGFLGVPSNSFEEAGRNQILTLLGEGLVPSAKVVEIGCGVLRVGYWLVRYLNANSYYGIEPASDRVELGINKLLSTAVLKVKNPQFDYNSAFNTSVFGQDFDFFLAGSIWTHCSKSSIRIMLDGFTKHSTTTGIFLTSYLPALNDEEDYQGDAWVGTSHESSIAGCIKHKLSWIQRECDNRNLKLHSLPQKAFDSQYWLKISKLPNVESPSYLRKFIEIFRINK